jgi:hypothetical protein
MTPYFKLLISKQEPQLLPFALQGVRRYVVHIEELTRAASLNFLGRSRFGRLACAKQSQPYVSPFYFVYQDPWIYSFSTVGQKIEWLRANPLACVQVDEIESPQQWTSVIVSARYEELTASTNNHTRELAHQFLKQRRTWWEPGYAKTIVQGAPRPIDPVHYRLSVEEISGRRATPD